MNKRPIWIIHGFVTGEVCVLSQATVPPTKNEVKDKSGLVFLIILLKLQVQKNLHGIIHSNNLSFQVINIFEDGPMQPNSHEVTKPIVLSYIFFLKCSEESTKENKKGGEWGTSINMICDSI